MGKGIMLIQRFVLKVTNNGRKILTYHEIIDLIAEQIVSVTTQVCKESKFWIHPNVPRPRFFFAYSFKFTFLYYRFMDLKKNKE